MLPPKTLRLVIFATNIGWYCGAIPFRFVKHRVLGHQIEPCFTKKRAMFVRTSFALNVFYISFIAFRLFHEMSLVEEVSLDFLVQMGYLFFSYAMTVVLQKNTLAFWEEIPHFTRRYLTFFGNIKNKFILPGERGPKCIKFFSCLLFIGMLVNLQNSIIILKKPDRLHFLTSILKDPLHTPLVLRLPFLLPQLWIWISTWAHVWTFAFHLYAYISCMVWTIRELDLKIKGPKTSKSFRDPQTFVKTIRSLQVLHRLWQHSHQSWFNPSHKAVAISVGTLASYGVIKLTGPRSIIMGFMTILALLYLWTIFRKFGQLYELSEQVRENWMNSISATKWMRKYLKSVPIFRIDIGSFYYVQKTTVISVMWTVLNNTITLLFL